MPRNYQRKSQRASGYSKEQLETAVNDVKSGLISINRASVMYKIPKTTLRDRVKGRRGVKSHSFGRDTDLPIEVEIGIAKAIKAVDQWGFGFSRKELLEKVGEFVKINNLSTRFKNHRPGADWFINFRKNETEETKKESGQWCRSYYKRRCSYTA